MVLTEHITKTCIVPELQAASKADALKEMTHLLFEKRKLAGMDLALDQIMTREATESTGIGRGIAVPHARVPGLKDLYCAVGRVSDGLDFHAVDRSPVHLIFLIVFPPKQQTTYLNFVATAAKLLRDKKHLRAMLEAQTVDEMHDVLEEMSQALKEEHVTKGAITADPEIEKTDDTHADLVVLARLQLYEEMLATARTGKKQIKDHIENMRSIIEPRVLKHYDRLTKSRAPALVPVEGDTCQGCYMKLSSQFAQRVREDVNHIHTCPNCSRYIYIV